MKKMIFWLILVLVLIVGCESEETTTTIETDEAEVVVTVVDAGEDNWCPAGGEWKYASEMDDGTNGEWKVIGLGTSGKYSGLCHVKYTAQTEDGEVVGMDYWFSEDGESGLIEMDVMGQKITQEWHKS